MSALRQQRYLLWLLAPLLLYLVPLALGYAWNSMFGPNVLNPPEGYSGRLPTIPITAESWGTAVVVVPFHARLAEFLRSTMLPLWNPYQGLGQPYAAQGEGSPYFPLAILRAVLPYSWSNWVTVVVLGAAGAFLAAFLRNLGLRPRAALFGGVAFTVSGIVLPHIARDNIADQLCMAPILFWATEAAVRERTARRFAILVVVSGLHALAGFVQIAMLGIVLAVALAFVGAADARSRRADLGWAVATCGAIGIGAALVGFCLLPMLEAMGASHSQNLRAVFTVPPVPAGNGVTFFLPLALGDPFAPSWVTPTAADPRLMANDWNDLFGFAGQVVLLLALGGASIRSWGAPSQRRVFWFALIGAGLLLLRYLSVPPLDLVDTLPPFAFQTRKHANGLTVLLLIVAAAIALDNLGAWRRALALKLQAAAVFLLYLEVAHIVVLFSSTDRAGVAGRFGEVGVHHLIVTVVSTLVIAAPFVLFAAGRLSARAFEILALALVIAEAVLYVPLGSDLPTYLYARLVIAGLVVGAGAIVAGGHARARVLAVAPAILAVVAYGALVAGMPAGLPRAFDADRSPRFMTWLRQQAGDQYRTFGIFPDFSSVGQIQDLGVVGPLAPPEFRTLVDVVSDDAMARGYDTSPIFMLAGRLNFGLGQYQRMRPVFDWLGVRYVVMDRAYFPLGGPEALAAQDPARFAIPYQDERVVIVESAGARPKAELWATVQVVPDRDTIVEMLRLHPEAALGPPLVEAADQQWLRLPEAQATGDAGLPGPATVTSYEPNRVEVAVNTAGPGLLVLKDVYTAGWSARVDGQPVQIARVNAMVRGIPIGGAGQHRVEMTYQPATLGIGAGLAGATALLVLAALAVGLVGGAARPLPAWGHAAGLVIAIAFLAALGSVGLGWRSAERPVTASAAPSRVPVAAYNPAAGQPSVLAADVTAGRTATLSPGATVLIDTTASLAGTGGSREVSVPPGALVLGADGTMQRAGPGGVLEPVVGEAGQRVRLANVGLWDVERRAYDGVDAVFDGSRWVIDASMLHAANVNPLFRLGSDANPAPGWAAAPSTDEVTVERLWDADGPFVRIRPKGSLSSIALQTAFPMDTLDGAPVSVRAQVRRHGGRDVQVGVYDQTGPSPDQVQAVTQSIRKDDEWTTLSLAADRISYPATVDTLYVAGYDVTPDDWLDVRELSLYVGTLPPGIYPTLLPDTCATCGDPRLPAPAPSRVDLSIGRPARQSVTEPGGDAFLAVDGNDATPSIAVGRDGLPPWWEIDLGESRPLDTIEVGFHPGCCADGGRSAYVFVSDQPFPSDDPIVTAATQSVLAFSIDAPTEQRTLRVGGRTARYVRVQSSRSGSLRLGSVRVSEATSARPAAQPGTPAADRPSLAQGRVTRQSSVLGASSGNFAVDGRTDGASGDPIAQTGPESEAWWEVDLGADADLGEVAVWNRLDCCREWLRRYYVLVSDTPFASSRLFQAAGQPGVRSYYVSATAGSPTRLPIRAHGRYVRIQLTGVDPLALVEVQVYPGS